MKRKVKILAAGLALGLLVGLLGSGVLAQTPTPPTPTSPYDGGYHMGDGDMPCHGADEAGSHMEGGSGPGDMMQGGSGGGGMMQGGTGHGSGPGGMMQGWGRAL